MRLPGMPFLSFSCELLLIIQSPAQKLIPLPPVSPSALHQVLGIYNPLYATAGAKFVSEFSVLEFRNVTLWPHCLLCNLSIGV